MQISTLLSTTVLNVNAISSRLNTTTASATEISTRLNTTITSATEISTRLNTTITSATEISTRLHQTTTLLETTIASVKNNASSSLTSINEESAYALMNALVPIGTMWPYAGRDAGQLIGKGWLPCDGTAYFQSEYPKLFAVIGRMYSPIAVLQDKFMVPNTGGRFLQGADNYMSDDPTKRWFYDVGRGGGSLLTTVTLSSANMPAHSHGVRVGTTATGVNTPGSIHKNIDPRVATLNLTASAGNLAKGEWNASYREPASLPKHLDDGYQNSVTASKLKLEAIFDQGGIEPAGKEKPIPIEIEYMPPRITVTMIIRADK